jgi:tetratricopeptide (TPR) repeat protein
MAAYDGGRYLEALRLYEAYASSGGEGAEVRYDMGNCALKAGDLGRAVLEYRKALRHDPDLQAARNNLEVARKLMPARKSPWQPPPWEAFLDGIPVLSIQWVVLGLALLANLAFCAALLASPGRGRRLLAGSVVSILTAGAVAGGLLFYAGSILPQRRPAIVVREAPVFPGPAAEGTPVDRLPPGSEVMLLKQAGDWRLVLWGDGRGWVSSTLVEAP